MRLWSLFLLGGVFGSESPPVAVSLTSKWKSAPLYVEAIEFVHTLKKQELFANFVTKFAKTPGNLLKSCDSSRCIFQ